MSNDAQSPDAMLSSAEAGEAERERLGADVVTFGRANPRV